MRSQYRLPRLKVEQNNTESTNADNSRVDRLERDIGKMSVSDHPSLMTTVMLEIEYKIYSDFLVSVGRLGFVC
jgi:hypothetical protein